MQALGTANYFIHFQGTEAALKLNIASYCRYLPFSSLRSHEKSQFLCSNVIVCSVGTNRALWFMPCICPWGGCNGGGPWAQDTRPPQAPLAQPVPLAQPFQTNPEGHNQPVPSQISLPTLEQGWLSDSLLLLQIFIPTAAALQALEFAI